VTRFVSEALAKHKRDGFFSGNDRIDHYSHENASQEVKLSYAACFVLIESCTGKVGGFHTLSAHCIILNDAAQGLAKKLLRYPNVPLGAGEGSMLLYDAISRVAKAPVGAYAICADTTDEVAVAFYHDHQFQPLVSRPQSLFLPMKTALAPVSG
jgi:hypothetical protein